MFLITLQTGLPDWLSKNLSGDENLKDHLLGAISLQCTAMQLIKKSDEKPDLGPLLNSKFPGIQLNNTKS